MYVPLIFGGGGVVVGVVDSRVVAFSVDSVDSVVGSGETVCIVAKKRRQETHYTVYILIRSSYYCRQDLRGSKLNFHTKSQ